MSAIRNVSTSAPGRAPPPVRTRSGRVPAIDHPSPGWSRCSKSSSGAPGTIRTVHRANGANRRYALPEYREVQIVDVAQGGQTMTEIAERPAAAADGGAELAHINHWINGQLVAGTSGRHGPGYDPATGQ